MRPASTPVTPACGLMMLSIRCERPSESKLPVAFVNSDLTPLKLLARADVSFVVSSVSLPSSESWLIVPDPTAAPVERPMLPR